MPTYMVTGPDGTKYRVTAPEGATEAEVMARVRGQSRRSKPTSFWQGLAEGVTKPAMNAARIISRINPIVNSLAMAGAPSPIDAIEARLRDTFNRSKARGSTAGKIAGEVLGTLPTAFLPGSGALGALAQGGAGGAMLANLDNPADVAKNAAAGGAGGLLGQQIGKHVIAPVAERIGRTAPARAITRRLASAASKATGRDVAPLPAPLTRAERTVSKAIPDIPSVAQNLDEASRMGLPYSLADADPKLRQLAGSVGRFSPDGRALAEANYSARTADRGFRAIQGVEDYLHPATDVKAVSQGIRDFANRKAGPYYDRALEGGSIAPLESQLDDAFNQSSRAVSNAAAELADAQRAATLASAQVNRAGNNVYMNAKSLPNDRSAQAAIVAAERKLAAARGNHEQVLAILRQAQDDSASNAPGAVWSPRVQQFLDDPITKGGLKRGIEIQRLEALASGKPFNPTEYAITGMDDAGDPIVGNVPNMRTLDSVKKGLDAIIDEYPKDFKGKPVLDERGRAVQQVLKSFRDEIDSINPDYGAARQVYQDAIRPREALDRGFSSTGKNVAARDLNKMIADMNPKELAQFRAGYATNLTDQIANAADRTNPYDLISKGINRPAKLEALYPEGADQFQRLRAIEAEMAKTSNEVLGGSQTQPRAVQDAMFQDGILGDVVDGGIEMMTGGGIPRATKMLGAVAQKIKDRSNIGLMGARKKADALAPVLFGTDPQAAQSAIEELIRRQAEQEIRKKAYQRSMGLLGGPGAVLGVAGAGQFP